MLRLCNKAMPGRLKRRNKPGCGNAAPAGRTFLCLKPLYAQRLAELQGQGTRWGISDWQMAQGTWTFVGSTPVVGQELKIEQVLPDRIRFTLNSGSGTHGGTIEGFARINADGALFNHADPLNKAYDYGACTLRLIPLGKDRLEIIADGCRDYGGGVPFGGLFLKGVHRMTPSLFDLGVVDSPQADAAFRNLTGKAYVAFVERLYYAMSDTPDLDGFGAKVLTGFVRGDAPNGAI